MTIEQFENIKQLTDLMIDQLEFANFVFGKQRIPIGGLSTELLRKPEVARDLRRIVAALFDQLIDLVPVLPNKQEDAQQSAGLIQRAIRHAFRAQLPMELYQGILVDVKFDSIPIVFREAPRGSPVPSLREQIKALQRAADQN